MTVPRESLERFVKTRFHGARLESIVGDASTRRYYRVHATDGRTFVLMDYGEPFEGETDDVRLERVFREADLPVAAIFGVEPRVGCLVLEDLGDRLLESEIRRHGFDSSESRALLERAVLLAGAVAERGTPALMRSERAGGPALDEARFRFEMDFFVENYAVRFVGSEHGDAGLVDALHTLADRAACGSRRVLCHRDFHSRNVLIRRNGELAMVDIQDARWGPDGYDLASLLYDAYVEIPEAWLESFVAAYRDRSTSSASPEEFTERLRVLAAQRMIKALGTFGYQVAVAGRDRYRDAIPRTIARLERTLPGHPATRVVHERLAAAGLLEASA